MFIGVRLTLRNTAPDFPKFGTIAKVNKTGVQRENLVRILVNRIFLIWGGLTENIQNTDEKINKNKNENIKKHF